MTSCARRSVERFGQAAPLHIAAMRVKLDRHVADLARDEIALDRTHHAHRDVGLAHQQILVAVRKREFERDCAVARAGARKYRGQHLRADDVARRDAHACRDRRPPRRLRRTPSAAAVAAIVRACGTRSSAASVADQPVRPSA